MIHVKIAQPFEAHLQLNRAPIFLRVVKAADGKVDALDLLDDEAAADEEIAVYIRHGAVGQIHLYGREKNGKRLSRWDQYANYAPYDVQPPMDVLRDNLKWRDWSLAEYERLQNEGKIAR